MFRLNEWKFKQGTENRLIITTIRFKHWKKKSTDSRNQAGIGQSLRKLFMEIKSEGNDSTSAQTEWFESKLVSDEQKEPKLWLGVPKGTSGILPFPRY